VAVHGEYWDARSTGASIADGERVQVVAVRDGWIDVASVGDYEEGSA
jgi:membrane-bound ClpP family serine protease